MTVFINTPVPPVPVANPPPPIVLVERLILAVAARAWTWEFNGGICSNRQLLPIAAAYAMYQPTLFHHIDPITAVVRELVTVEELEGHYPPGFVSMLQLLKFTK